MTERMRLKRHEEGRETSDWRRRRIGYGGVSGSGVRSETSAGWKRKR
jgi:hypothetical protein